MLPSLSQTASGSARRTLLFLTAIAVAALAFPTLKWATQALSAGPVVVVVDDGTASPGGKKGTAVDRREKSGAEPSEDVPVPEVEYLPRPSKFEEQVLKALEKPIDVEFSDMALEDCIDHLRIESKLPIWFDKQTLTDEGVALDSPVTLKLKATRLESVLNLLLHPRQLEYLPENEVLMITTMTKAGESLITRTYPVRDLVYVPKLPGDDAPGTQPDVPANQPGNTAGERGQSPAEAKPAETKPSTGAANQVLKQGFGGGGMGGGMGMGGAGGGAGGGGRGGGGMSGGMPRYVRPRDGLDFTSLMNLISSTIQPDSWEDLSGPGSMMPHRNSGSLVIRQTLSVHRDIQQLFGSLREAKRLAPDGKVQTPLIERK